MKWIKCSGDFTGRNKGPYPTESGHYRVMVEGDSECDDMGGVIYEFGDYETWASIRFDEEGGIAFNAPHDEQLENMIAWYGPIEIPEVDCFEVRP